MRCQHASHLCIREGAELPVRMISPWRRDLSPCSCKAHPIGTQTGEAEVLHLSADKAGSSPFWKLDRSEILACRDRRVWQKSLRRNKLKLLQRLIMLYRKVNAMHGSVSADRYLQEPNQELSSITAIIISLIVNSWDKRHLVRISQLKQKEKKNQEKKRTPLCLCASNKQAVVSKW
jgi:hypothetical protein